MPVSGISSAASPSTATSGKSIEAMDSQDFLKLLIAELSNQDPFEPMKNQDLMSEVGSIRNLQMTSDLNQTLKSLAFQGLAAASNMIGKTVAGDVVTADGTKTTVTGVVQGVTVSEKNEVQLVLDSGIKLKMDQITQVAAAPAAPTAQQAG